MIKSLLFGVAPHEGESIRGYLLRLAGANYMSRMNWTADMPKDIAKVKSLTGVTLQGHVPGWLEYASMEKWPVQIADSHLLVVDARCCPRCLEELGYWPVEWEHTLYAVCHRHGCLLVESCPRCSNPLRWNRPTLDECSCGEPIKNWPSGPSCESSEKDLCMELAASIRRKIAPCVSIQSEFSKLLRDPSLEDLTTLIHVLGTQEPNSRNTNRNLHLPKIHRRSRYPLLRNAANLLTDWPHRFRAHLNLIGWYDDEDWIEFAPASGFSKFTRAIRKKMVSPGLKFVLDEYRSFVINNWIGVLTHRNRWPDDEIIDHQRYVSCAVAAKFMKISTTQVARLVEAQILKGYVKETARHRKFVVVERESIAYAESKMADLVEIDVAAALLGLPRTRIAELVECGLLEKHQGDGKLKRYFSRAEIAAFLRRLMAGHRVAAAESEEELLPMKAILKIYLATEKEFISLVESLQSKMLTPVLLQTEKSGLGGIAIGRAEFFAWRRLTRAGNGGSDFTVDQAARQLGIKQEVGYHLVAKGLLRSSTGVRGRRRCQLVASADIGEFKATYASGSELAKSRGTSAKMVIARLRERGILPVAGPSVDSCRQTFFRRSDISRN